MCCVDLTFCFTSLSSPSDAREHCLLWGAWGNNGDNNDDDEDEVG